MVSPTGPVQKATFMRSGGSVGIAASLGSAVTVKPALLTLSIIESTSSHASAMC